MKSSVQAQRGFSLVMAIIVLVTLAVLATLALVYANAQLKGSESELQAARATQAARAGLEWAAAQINTTTWCQAVPISQAIEPDLGCDDAPRNPAPAVAISGTLSGAIGFLVTISCSASSHTEQATTDPIPKTVWSYRLESKAVSQCSQAGQASYAEKTLSLNLEK